MNYKQPLPAPTPRPGIAAAGLSSFIRRRWQALLPGMLAVAALGGCYHATPPPVAPTPAPVVLDYRNGWYHKASGTEPMSAIATRYKRDAALVTELNLAAGTFAVPARDTMIYIPPSNDRKQVRVVLTRLQGHPDLIPKIPWDPESAKRPAPTPTPAPVSTPALPLRPLNKEARVAKVKHAETQAPLRVASATVLRPNNPLPETHNPSELTRLEPPAPGTTEKVIAEPKRGFFGWLFGGGKNKKAPAPAPAPKAAPVPAPHPTAPPSNGYTWPLKGQLVSTFKGGWRQACHGIEIAAVEGTPVLAARTGKVLLAQDYPGYGNLVVVDHGDGYTTAYGYNRQMLVQPGQHVERGQTIASVGRLSQGSSSKLLFQVRRNSIPVDPLPFLKE